MFQLNNTLNMEIASEFAVPLLRACLQVYDSILQHVDGSVGFVKLLRWQ